MIEKAGKRKKMDKNLDGLLAEPPGIEVDELIEVTDEEVYRVEKILGQGWVCCISY
jgi:hypothetical protein